MKLTHLNDNDCIKLTLLLKVTFRVTSCFSIITYKTHSYFWEILTYILYLFLRITYPRNKCEVREQLRLYSHCNVHTTSLYNFSKCTIYFRCVHVDVPTMHVIQFNNHQWNYCTYYIDNYIPSLSVVTQP